MLYNIEVTVGVVDANTASEIVNAISEALNNLQNVENLSISSVTFDDTDFEEDIIS